MEKKVQYLLDNKFAEQSISPWASPCILVPKPDGTYRFCTSFRKVNSVTVMDSFSLPLVEELIDRVGRAKIITTLDLNKGYWQIPLIERAGPLLKGQSLFHRLSPHRAFPPTRSSVATQQLPSND